MISSRAWIAAFAVAAAGPACAGDELRLPASLNAVPESTLSTLRGQALVQWQGLDLLFTLDRAAPGLAPSGGAGPALVLQNAGDARAIAVMTTINATLSQAGWLSAFRANAAIRDAAVTFR